MDRGDRQSIVYRVAKCQTRLSDLACTHDCNPTLGKISRRDENSSWKRYMHPNVHNSTIYNSQDMETTQVPNSRNKLLYIKQTSSKDLLYVFVLSHISGV